MNEGEEQVTSLTKSLPDGKSVFHYTDSEGLLGILSSGVLRATEASGLNDPSEILYGESRIRDILPRHADSEMCECVASNIGRANDASDGDRSRVFFLSASLSGDDVNQWRSYSGNGRGYCIELDSAIQLAVRTTEASNEGGLLGRNFDTAQVSSWTPVIYSEPDQSEAVAKLVSSLESLSDSVLDSYARDYEDWDITPQDELEYYTWSYPATLSRLMKAPGFIGEQEARISVTFMFSDRYAHFRTSSYGLVKYVELTTQEPNDGYIWFAKPEDRRNLPIRSVCVGPALNFDHGKQTLRSLLNRYGYDESVAIRGSEVTLR